MGGCSSNSTNRLSFFQNSQQGRSSCRKSRGCAFFNIGCDLVKKAV